MAFDTLASIGFVADTRQLKQAGKDLDHLSNRSRSAEASTGTLTRSMGALAASVGSVVSVLAGSQKLIAVTREFDILNAGLITATGNADNAAKAFKALEDFARETPYSLAQATKAFTQLVNLGLTPSEAALKSYGNTAAAMGKDLSMMVEAVADATVGEFERLKEFGIKSQAQGDQVTFTFRGVSTTVKKSAAEIEGYLMNIGNTDFAGAMENRMNSLDGAISNLSDSWDGLFRTISSQGAGTVITDTVRLATSAIDELTASIASGQLMAQIDAIIGKFDGFGRDVAVVLDFVGQLFADAGEFWYLDMSESARLIIDAFKNIPENIRAFIQIATVELSAFVDGVAVYAKAIASYLDITSETVDIESEFARIGAARVSSIESILGQRDAALQSFNSQMGAADGLRIKYDELSSSVDNGADRLEQYKVVVDGAAKSTAQLVKEMNKLDDAALDYFDALEELDEIEKNRIARKEEEIEAILEPFEEGSKAVKEYQSISEKAAERIESAFADAWMNAFDGFESVVDGMKNAFKRMLAEMAHMALTRPIMVSMGMGGMLPGGASAATGGISSGLGLLGGVGSSLIGAGGMIGGAFGGGLAGAGGLIGAGQFGTLFSGASSLLGSGNIMAGLGMATPIIAGLGAALAGIQKLSGGGLFGTSFKTTGQSLGLSLGGGDISGLITTEESRKKSLFRGTKRRTTTTDFDTSAIDAAFDQITSALGQAANTFGIVGADEIIKGFSASANINIKDKTEEEVQAAIAEWVSGTTSALVDAVFGDSLDGLQKEGEGVIDTVNRLSMNMGAVQSITKALGLDFNLTGKAAMIASTNIVELAGGIEQLSALSSLYYQAFYSDAERQSMLMEQLTGAFSDLNIALPESRESFRAIVDGLDLTSEAGQKLFAELMKLVPGLDQYLSGVEALTAVSKEAADAAIAEAEAKAKAEALKAQGLDLQLRLYDALGQSSEALALRRQMEIEATDESLHAILQQIYAAQDAAAAQRELETAQNAAAEAARNAASAAIDATQNAFSKLQEAAGLEKDRLATELDIKLSTIDAERSALEKQRDTVISGYNAQGQAINDYAKRLDGLSGVINDFLDQTSAVQNPFKRLAEIFTEVKSGLLPEQSDLQAALSAVSSAGTSGFNSANDADFAMAVARNQAAEIGKIIGGRASGASAQAMAIEIQTAKAESYFNAEMTRLDEAKSLSQSQHDEQVGKIDAQLSEAQKQLNALLGVDDRILTMSEAAAEFYAALESANGLQAAIGTEQIAAINAVEAAVLSLIPAMQESQAPEFNKPEDRIWLPPVIDTPEDRIWLPPVIDTPPMQQAALTQEVIELLMELVAGNEAIAKHTKTSADVLELNQFESQEAVV